MRRLLLPLTVAVLALACASSAAAAPLFVLSGSGWGHGVGMSQYGAQGKALRGLGYRDILEFYYQGTTLGPHSKSKVRVLLADGRASVTLSSAAKFTVGTKTLAANTAYTVVPAADGKVKIVGEGKFANPVMASPGTAPLSLGGLRYRGSFNLWVKSGRISVVNHVRLEHYLFAVVPREMPASFAPEALKAQAVAARSYAVRAQRASWFDLYADTRDQVYGGLDKPSFGNGEDPRTTTAVQATAGEVVFYGSTVAQTFFSSSNGGVQAASVDTWGGAREYLLSRNDPDDLIAANPNRSWTVKLSAAGLAKRLGASRTPTDAVVTDRASGRVNRMRLERPGWSQSFPTSSSTLGPEYFRWALGLKSSRFDLGVLSIIPSRGKIVCGKRVRLDVIARHVSNVRLQRRPATGGSWVDLAMSDLGGGNFVATHKPCVKTGYRLTSPAATGAKVAVRVRAAVYFAAEQPASGALTGVVRPKSLAGTAVTVERRRSDGTWLKKASAVVRSDGTWTATFAVRAGIYRARVFPPSGSGLLPGVSPELVVKTS
jgi:stage II sporulation protein D